MTAAEGELKRPVQVPALVAEIRTVVTTGTYSRGLVTFWLQGGFAAD